MEKIEVKSSSSAPWNPKNDVQALHIYCAANQEDQVNKVLCSIYNKNRKWMNMQSNLSEGNIFGYFPYNMKNKIALTPCGSAEFTKGKVVQSYAVARHNAVTI